MPKKKSLADELADLFNPAPAKGERAEVRPGAANEDEHAPKEQRLLPVPPCRHRLRRHRRPRLLPICPPTSGALLPFHNCIAEFDPEADVFGAGPALEESDEELAVQAPARRCSSVW